MEFTPVPILSRFLGARTDREKRCQEIAGKASAIKAANVANRRRKRLLNGFNLLCVFTLRGHDPLRMYGCMWTILRRYRMYSIVDRSIARSVCLSINLSTYLSRLLHVPSLSKVTIHSASEMLQTLSDNPSRVLEKRHDMVASLNRLGGEHMRF